MQGDGGRHTRQPFFRNNMDGGKLPLSRTENTGKRG
jgi:hypothetical protein